MVKVCDKCRTDFQPGDKIQNIEDDEYEAELCSKCMNHIMKWVRTPEKKKWFSLN